MSNKKAEEIIKLNNGEEVVKKFQEKDFNNEILYMKRIGGRFVEPNITKSNIKHNSEFIVNLFDEKVDKPKTLSKRRNE